MTSRCLRCGMYSIHAPMYHAEASKIADWIKTVLSLSSCASKISCIVCKLKVYRHDKQIKPPSHSDNKVPLIACAYPSYEFGALRCQQTGTISVGQFK